MKRCPGCGRDKPRSEFWRSRHTKDGLRSRCITCAKKQSAAWRAANPEKDRASTARWQAANHDRRLATQRRNRARLVNDPEWVAERRDYHREYYRRTHGVPPARYRAKVEGGRAQVDAEPVRHAVEASRLGMGEIARTAGFDDAAKLARRLEGEHITAAVADRILDAIGVLPVEVGL